jgi:hypothetical protein
MEMGQVKYLIVYLAERIVMSCRAGSSESEVVL